LFKIYIDTALKEWSRKCKGMGLKIEDNCYVQHLVFSDDVVITRGEEYVKWGLKIGEQEELLAC
jgi:hypothetical protein